MQGSEWPQRTPLPIRIADGTEPFTRAARSETPILAESDAYRMLFRELERYVDGGVSGRSFLISGHRGSGKTTLVLQAVQEVEARRRSAQAGGLPLLIRLRGAELLPSPGEAPPSTTKTGGSDEPPGEEAASEDESGARDKNGESSKGKRASKPGAAQAPAAKKVPRSQDEDDTPQTFVAQHALKQITLAIYRALATRVADAFEERLDPVVAPSPGASAPPVEADAPTRPETIQSSELAAQLRLALDEAPGPARLRELWRRAGVLESGVFAARKDSSSGAQGFREVVALASAAQAYRVVSGTFEQKESGEASAEMEASRETGASLAVKDASRQLLAILTGGAAGAGLLLKGPPGLLAGVAAAVVAVTVSWSLKFAGKRAARRTVSEEYSFIRDRTVSTLERELPVLVERLHAAGLAPVFVVDELDKVDLLPDRMEQVVNRLKHFVTEGAFFCFLTDRDYFEHLRDRALHTPYPREYTYFTDRLLVLYRPSDLHAYLGKVLLLTPGAPEELTDREVLPYVLLHRARMHPVDLRRELVKLRRSDGLVELEQGEVVSGLAYRFAVTIQLAVEVVLEREQLAQRLDHDPNFGQPVYDALYYPSRKWAEGEPLLDLGEASFRTYLTERMSPNRPQNWRRSRRGLTALPAEESAADGELPLSDQDFYLLLEQARALVELLLDPEALTKELETIDPDRRISAAAVQTILTDPRDRLLAMVEPGRYRWRFDPFGRSLRPAEPGPAAAERPSEASPPSPVPTPEEEKRKKTPRRRAKGRPREAKKLGTEAPLEPEDSRLDAARVVKEERKLGGPLDDIFPMSFQARLASAGVDLVRLEEQRQFLRQLDDWVIEVTGRLDLQRLADEVYILDRSPAWLQVREALERLHQLELRHEDYEGMSADAGLVADYVTKLERRSRVLAECFGWASSLGTAAPADDPKDRLVAGLRALSRVFRFQDMRSEREMEDALGGLALDDSPHDLADLEQATVALTPRTFSTWTEQLALLLVYPRGALTLDELAEAQASAWQTWNDRLRRFVLTQESRYRPTVDDLVCQAAEIPPATLLEFDLRRVTLAAWSRIASLAAGWEFAVGRPISGSLRGSATPAWALAPALARLGLGSLLSTDSGTLQPPIKAWTMSSPDPPSEEEWSEVDAWRFWIQDRQPRWFEPRPTALVVAGIEGSIAANWLPSASFGGWLMEWNPALPVNPPPFHFPGMQGPEASSVRLILLDETGPNSPALASLVPALEALPTVRVTRGSPQRGIRSLLMIVAPESFDDAMKQALKLVGGAA